MESRASAANKAAVQNMAFLAIQVINDPVLRPKNS
jgi:hypothetical protein